MKWMLAQPSAEIPTDTIRDLLKVGRVRKRRFAATSLLIPRADRYVNSIVPSVTGCCYGKNLLISEPDEVDQACRIQTQQLTVWNVITCFSSSVNTILLHVS